MPRRALLLGIPDYDAASLKSRAPGNDVSSLKSVLMLAGVPEPHINCQTDGLTTSRMRRSIGALLEGAEAGDEILLYFSGHGLVFEGRRLFVPVDYEPDYPLTVSEMISDLDIYAQARDSKAASIIVFTDCCREGVRVKLGKSSAAKSAVSFDVPVQQQAPTIAFVHSCQHQSLSYFDTGEDGQSHFTTALCQVLYDEHGPSTLIEIVSDVARRLTDRGRGQIPELGESIKGRAGDPTLLLVKEDAAARTRQRIRDSRWCNQLHSFQLYDDLRESPALQQQLEVVVLRSEEVYQQAARRNGGFRWRPSDPIRRTLTRLPVLLAASEQGPLLSVPEAALLLAAPYVHEAVLALAELQLASEGDPLSPSPGAESTSYMAKAWRTAFHNDDRWQRRRDLVQQRADSFARDVAGWQLVRFLHRSGELWQIVKSTSDRRVWLGEALDRVLAVAPFADVAADPRTMWVLNPERLVQFARFLFCSYRDINLVYGTSRSSKPAVVRIGEGSMEWEINEEKIAHLLSLTGRMACDARRLPDSPAEHVGIDAVVDAPTIVNALDDVEWHRTGDGRVSLTAQCFHQALDYALEQEVIALDEHFRRLHEQFPDEPWAAALPRYADCTGLTPVQHDGRSAYSKPHVRLQLDPERIRQLLMGRRLYGDPRYALREAYQNALDACRYRRARHEYLSKSRAAESTQYLPVISIRTGTDERGRPFVECEDNGIGMESRHLEGLFALAGRRFADSHEFHTEKAAWDELGVRFWSNSRFGIGVLAYFMLADEVVVWTRRMSDRYQGPTERCLVARILSGTELFRIGEELGAIPSGGTRVRLYLDGRPDDMRGTALLDSVSTWLAQPEVDVQLIHDGRLRTMLKAGILNMGAILKAQIGDIVWPIDDTDAVNQQRLFCVLSDRDSTRVARSNWRAALPWNDVDVALLDGVAQWCPIADGIAVQQTDSQKRENRDRASIIVNLKAEYSPALSVDRNTILSWEDGKTWARGVLREKLFAACVDCESMTLADLGYLAKLFPYEAMLYNRVLADAAAPGRQVRVFSGETKALPVTHVGVSQQDDDLAELAAATLNAKRGNAGGRRGFLNRIRERGGVFRWSDTRQKALRARLVKLHEAGWTPNGAVGSLAVFDARHGGWPDFERATRHVPITILEERHKTGIHEKENQSVSPWKFLMAAIHLELSLDEAAELVRGLAETDVVVPAMDLKESRVRPSQRLNQLMSTALNGEAPFIEKLTPYQVVRAAAYWRISIGEVMEIAHPMIVAGIEVPFFESAQLTVRPDPRIAEFAPMTTVDGVVISREIVLAAITWKVSLGTVIDVVKSTGLEWGDETGVNSVDANWKPEKRVAELLSIDFDGNRPFIKELAIQRLIAAASRWRVSLNEVVGLGLRLARVGFPMSALHDSQTVWWPDESVLQVASRSLTTSVDNVEVITASRLVATAASEQLTLGQIMKSIGPLAMFGVKVPEIEPQVLNWRPDYRVGQLVSLDLDGVSPFIESLTPWQVARAAVEWKISVDEVVKIAEPLRHVGMAVPLEALAALEWRPGTRLDDVISRNKDGIETDVDMVTQLVYASARWQVTIGEMAESIRPLCGLGVPVPIFGEKESKLRLDEGAFANIMDMIDVGVSLSPLLIAFLLDASVVSVEELTAVIGAMELMGIDVEECREFLESMNSSNVSSDGLLAIDRASGIVLTADRKSILDRNIGEDSENRDAQ